MGRVNHHKEIIEQIRWFLDGRAFGQDGYVFVELHTTSMKRMPAQLKGVPDVIISRPLWTTYVEIKPIYSKSRDRLNNDQCRFACDIYPLVSPQLRYWVVQDFKEFEHIYLRPTEYHIDGYHQATVETWCQTRGREIPWD